MTQQFNDFVVDTRGHCFLCLTQTTSLELNSRELKQRSVHSLSRYLKLDMSKVFHEKESIPSELLENVKRSRLKVALCEKCSQWNDRISALCRQLEKIETEVTSYLQLVHEGLLRSSGDDRTDLFSDNDSNSNLEFKEKGRIVKVLRTEAMQRCSQKIKSAKPRVTVQKLTVNQVVSRKLKAKFNEDGMPDSISMNVDQVKIENHHHDADGRDDFDDAADEYGGTASSGDEDLPNNEEAMEDDPCSLRQQANQNQVPHSHPAISVKNVPTPVLDREGRQTFFGSVGRPSTGTVAELTFAVNPQTGKLKCGLCGKEFSHRHTLLRHHQSAHIGVRFKCDLCGKCFTQLKSLTQHQQSVHLGQRFQCKLCSRSFTHKFMMAAHMRKEHPQ